MQSITQLLKTIKKFNAEAYVFLNNIEPLVLSETFQNKLTRTKQY